MIWFLVGFGVGVIVMTAVALMLEAYLLRRIERLQTATRIALKYTMERCDRDDVIAALEYSKGQ